MSGGERIPLRLRRAREKCRQQPMDPDSWHELGLLHLEYDESRQGRVCFEREVALRPDARALYSLGSALLMENKPDNAIAPLERAHALDPDDAEIAAALGIAYLRHGERSRAKPLLTIAADADPENEEARMGLARIAAAEGDPWRAIELCNHILKHQPIDEQSPLMLMGDSFLAVQGLPQAEKCYSAAVQLEPTNVPALVALSQVHLLQGQDRAAETELGEAMKLDPSRSEIHLGFGTLWVSREELQKAQASYEKAIQLDPENVKAYGALAAVLLLQGEGGQAESFAKRGLASAPRDPECLLVAAQAAELRGRPDEAARLAERAVEAAPQNYQAHLILARAEMEMKGDLEKASRELELAEQLTPPGDAQDRVRRLRQALSNQLGADSTSV